MDNRRNELGRTIAEGMHVYKLSWFEDSWDGIVLSINEDGVARVQPTGTDIILDEKCWDLDPYSESDILDDLGVSDRDRMEFRARTTPEEREGLMAEAVECLFQR